MGILADFFTATPQDAQAYAAPAGQEDHSLLARVAPVQFKGFTSLEVETLWAILDGREWDPATYSLIDESDPTEQESWLFRFPDPLIAHLASLAPAGLEAVSSHWAATEELNCSPADVAPVIRDLQAMAKRSLETGQPMYLWGCL